MTAFSATRTGRARRPWRRIFLSGLVLWVLTVVVTFLTRNPNLVPTLVLLGSFLIPITFVFWAFERRDTGEIAAPRRRDPARAWRVPTAGYGTMR